MKKCLKNYTKDLTTIQFNNIVEYLNAYNCCKNIFYNMFQNKIDIIHVPYKNEIRDNLVKQLSSNTLPKEISGVLNKYPAKLQKYALNEAITNLKANYSNLKNVLRTAINSNKNFNEQENYYARYILTSHKFLHLLNNSFNVPLFTNDISNLCFL